MTHVATSSTGGMLGFAISGVEGRGSVFPYEIHVAEQHRGHASDAALIDLVKRSIESQSRSKPMIELNVPI